MPDMMLSPPNTAIPVFGSTLDALQLRRGDGGFKVSSVAGICSAPIVAEVRARGLDVESLVDGLDTPLPIFENVRGRVPWKAFVPFAARAEKMLGATVLEDLAAEATVAAVPKSFRLLLPRLTDARTLFSLAPRWWGPRVFNGTSGFCEALPDGRLREIVRIAPEHQASSEFLSGLRGTLRAMPRLTNQSDAIVELDQDGREGEFLITPPPMAANVTRGLLGRWRAKRHASRTERTTWEAVRELEEFGFASERLLHQDRELHLLASEADHGKRQRETLRQMQLLLSQYPGRDFRKLQEAIVDLLVSQRDVVAARVAFFGTDSTEAHEVTRGRFTGLPDFEIPLCVAGIEVGILSLWATLEGDELESLRPLSVWIALVLELGRTRTSNAHLTRMLAQDVGDWQELEQRLEALSARLPNVSEVRRRP